MLRAAAEAAGGNCLVVAVSVLTSLDAAGIAKAWGRDGLDLEREVLRLARSAVDVGIRGLVCSGHEAAQIRAELGNDLKLIVPGIRFADGGAQDQARVVTPAGAARAGADYVVLGRAVTASSDPVGAMLRVNAELQSALNE